MRSALFVLAAGVALALPADTQAQAGRATGRTESGTWQRESRGGGVVTTGRARGRAEARNDRRDDRRDRDRDRWDDRRDRDRDRDRWDDRRDRRRNGNGPAFCRDNRGHPVHDREWCRRKGWDSRDRWDRVSWGDVIFRRPNYRHSTIGERLLRDMLGNNVFLRLDGYRESAGYARGYTGSWRPQGGGYTLFINAGGVPIAQLIDANGDGRAESVLLHRR